MRKISLAVALLLITWFITANTGSIRALAEEGPARVTMLDDCDPTDPTFPPPGCVQKDGDVTNAEFGFFLNPMNNPLSAAVIGHLAWRNDPGYLKMREGDKLRVRNRGGRPHTFTSVAAFGGGIVPNPALNFGLTQAPECLASTVLPPGTRIDLEGLEEGDYRFQCCFHPWMRTQVKVKSPHGSR